ncbi:MAG: hypothetical protein SFY32_06920 [Bacteroidota bacterium]|nr:hypothetical protein [Bacteroidota bacterium]
MDELKDKVQKVGNWVKALYPRNNTPPRNEALQADTEWGAAYFWSEVILASRESNYNISLDILNNLKERYEEQTGKKVDIDFLMEKQWLRIVLGLIEIPDVVLSACWQLDKLSSIKEEEKGHYASIIKWQYELSFLKFVLDVKSDRSEFDIISKPRLVTILRNHRFLFPQTPSLQFFKSKNIIREGKTGCYILKPNHEYDFVHSLFDKIFVLLWEKVIQDNRFKNDKDRLLFILIKTSKIRSWNENFESYITTDSKNRLFNAAKELILNESDIITGEDEIKKMRLEHGEGKWMSLESSKHYFHPPLPNNGSIFNLFDSLNLLNKRGNSDMVYHQGTRNNVGFLINIIVKNDDKYHWNSDTLAFPRIRELYSKSNNRPYLLWELSNLIKEQRKELLPELLLESNTASLGFRLLFEKDRFHRPQELFSSEISYSIVKEVASIILSVLWSTRDHEPEICAQVIFECLLTTGRNNYYNIKVTPHIEEHKTVHSLFKKELEITFVKGKHDRHKNNWFDRFQEVSHSLLNSIETYDYDFERINDVIGLPFIKLDLLLWLYDCCNKHNFLEGKDELLQKIAKVALETYIYNINLNEVDTKILTEQNPIPKLIIPLWAVSKRQVEEFPWVELAIIFNRHHFFIQFLSPCNLKFQKAEDDYDKHNRFIAEKLRTHLFILLLTHKELTKYRNKPEYTGEIPLNILNLIETTVLSYISKGSLPKPKEAQVDLFNEFLERNMWTDDHIELLPLISQTLNQFQTVGAAKEIVKSIIKSETLIRSLKLLEYAIGEQSREFLIDQIRSIDIKVALDEIRWLPDIQAVLSLITSHESFIDKSKIILERWEKIIDKKDFKTEHKIFGYRIKLLLAYIEGDMQKIAQLEQPKLNKYRISVDYTFNPIEDKEFYVALLYLKQNEPHKAYDIFNKHLKNSDDRPTLALNRFASKIKWAEKETELNRKELLYKESLTEWLEFEKTANSKDIYQIQEKIEYNKLDVYDKLNAHSKFDETFSKLETAVQLQQDFLKLRIINLNDRDMQIQAESLLTKAEIYHRLGNGIYPSFIYDLRNLINDSNPIDEYRNQYIRIMTQSTDNLVKIIPDNINKYNTVEEFILHELIESASDVLTYINSIDEIRIEDKYTDLLLLSLNGRLKMYFLKLGNQRGGFSYNPKMRNPGERDFVICDASNRQIAVCEALNLFGKNTTTTKSHNLKIFNYSPERKLFFIIVYYLGNGSKFKTSWSNYTNDVIPKIGFPSEYNINGLLEDLSSKGFGSDSVKVGKALHGSETVIYHLYVNINYKT